MPAVAGFVPRAKPGVVPLDAVIAGVDVPWAAGLLHSSYGWRMGASWLVCAMAGVVLDQAALGFATTWRAFIADRRGEGLSAQGEAFGTWLEGFVQPAGISMAVGAFICGVAMQLGGGCASGTLPPWLVA